MATSRVARFGSLVAVACVATSCRPDLGDAPTLVTATRIVAVVAEPPEAAPGANVSFTAIVADGAGPVAPPETEWAFCAAPKPLTENGTVNADCARGAGLRAIATDGAAPATASAALPTDGCALFGPDTPPGGFRPRDPDGTGGFYQPLRVDVGAVVAFPLVRIRCNLANASVEIARAFAAGYVANRNPHLSAVVARVDGVEAPFDALPAGRAVTFGASWPAEDAESYLAFDTASRALVTRREAMRVSWFATSGSFASEHTGRGEDDPATSTENVWTAPAATGTTHLWVVLRDARGGAVASTFALGVVR